VRPTSNSSKYLSSQRTEDDALQNVLLDDRCRGDIDRQIGKLLRDLGNPEPPLRLEYVRELLSLDLAYYSSQDYGVVRETVHRLKVAGKQVLQRPGLLLDAIRKFDVKALWVPDRKRILIDAELPKLKHRWAEAHEVSHSVIPWHESMLHGDQKQTLSLACELQLEAEANYGAGRLLCLQGEFDERFRSSTPDLEHIRILAKEFGNTITSTLWRAVEALDVPAFGIVSGIPKPADGCGVNEARYFIRSRSFASIFGQCPASELVQAVRSKLRGGRGPLGQCEIPVLDGNGQLHEFVCDGFCNNYDTLMLGVHESALVKVSGRRPAV